MPRKKTLKTIRINVDPGADMEMRKLAGIAQCTLSAIYRLAVDEFLARQERTINAIPDPAENRQQPRTPVRKR